MKNLPTFEDFLKESLIFEGIDGQKVAIFPGRFQPFHNGHLASMKRCADVFQLKVIPLQIISKNNKSPFPEKLLQTMGEEVARNHPFLEKFFIYPPGNKTVIPQMVKFLQEKGYNPIGMGAGSDREKAYKPQIDYLTSDRSDVPVDEFRLEITDVRVPGGPSGTKVREAIAADDRKLFEELTPKELHRFYDKMKKFL